jgi:prophage regulatory protein
MRRTMEPRKSLLLTRSDLRGLGIHYSPAHLLRLEGASRFPRRVRLSTLRVAWLQEEVLGWIEQRAAERDSEIIDAK